MAIPADLIGIVVDTSTAGRALDSHIFVLGTYTFTVFSMFFVVFNTFDFADTIFYCSMVCIVTTTVTAGTLVVDTVLNTAVNQQGIDNSFGSCSGSIIFSFDITKTGNWIFTITLSGTSFGFG